MHPGDAEAVSAESGPELDGQGVPVDDVFGAGSLPDPAVHFGLAAAEAEVELDHDGIELGVDEAQHGSEHEVEVEAEHSASDQHAPLYHDSVESTAHSTFEDAHPHPLDGIHPG